jgi:uncharacterized membrane protein
MKELFSPEDQHAIQQAIAAAEGNTSGEIRVHIDHKCSGDPYERAIQVFQALKMHETSQQNGVLIYVATESHKMAIVGDKGINAVVPHHFWEDERDLMISHFKKGDFVGGLTRGIYLVGEQLKVFFPYASDDKNELSNEVTFDNDEQN